MSETVIDTAALAERSLDWLVVSARDQEAGSLAWPVGAGDEEVASSLYDGTAGVVVTLLEAHAALGVDRYAEMAERGARWLAAHLEDVDESGLYLGLTGVAYSLHAVEQVLGSSEAGAASRRALDMVRSRFDGVRWNECTELLYGHAGVILGALAAGDLDLALLAAEALVSLAEPTEAGVWWNVKLDLDSRLHNMAHGTVGIAYALSAVGEEAGRSDLVDLALVATRDVLSRSEDDGGDGFIVHTSDPQLESLERYTFGWCHGPTGDAQLFRLLDRLHPGQGWDDLVTRCWRTVLRSGIPARIRPGFWDNNGHCCGTAGVLALALDLGRDGVADLEFANRLVADLGARATVHADGARWSNVEFRNQPPELPAQPGWAHGNAGIIRELLRSAGTVDGIPPPYRVPWPDQPIR